MRLIPTRLRRQSPSPGPDRAASKELYRKLAAGYQQSPAFERMRHLAIEALAPGPGDVVLDIGCGTGLSFAPLLERVGPTGQVVGVDQSPEMLALARERITRQGWTNVTLLEASVEDVALPAGADGALLVLTHDILRSPRALANLFGALRPGARVAAGSTKWVAWWAWPLLLYQWQIHPRYQTTLEGFGRPWSRLPPYLPDLQVRSLRLGNMFVAWGMTRSS